MIFRCDAGRGRRNFLKFVQRARWISSKPCETVATGSGEHDLGSNVPWYYACASVADVMWPTNFHDIQGFEEKNYLSSREILITKASSVLLLQTRLSGNGHVPGMGCFLHHREILKVSDEFNPICINISIMTILLCSLIKVIYRALFDAVICIQYLLGSHWTRSVQIEEGLHLQEHSTVESSFSYYL